MACVFSKCRRCGKNLDRYSLESFIQGLFKDGDTYAPGIKCKRCGERYRVCFVFHVVWGLITVSGVKCMKMVGPELIGVDFFYFALSIFLLVAGYLIAWWISPFTKV